MALFYPNKFTDLRTLIPPHRTQNLALQVLVLSVNYHFYLPRITRFFVRGRSFKRRLFLLHLCVRVCVCACVEHSSVILDPILIKRLIIP